MEFIIQGLAAGFVIGFLVLAINLLKSVGEKGLEIGEKGFKQAKKIVKEVQDNAKSDKQKVLDLDEKILLIAQKEIDDKKQIKPLWMGAKVLSGGDISKAEIEVYKITG